MGKPTNRPAGRRGKVETVYTIEWMDGVRRATVDASLAATASEQVGTYVKSVTVELRPKPPSTRKPKARKGRGAK